MIVAYLVWYNNNGRSHRIAPLTESYERSTPNMVRGAFCILDKQRKAWYNMNKEQEQWITLKNGVHILLKPGQSKADAIKKFTDEQERKNSLKEKSADQLKRESMVQIGLRYFSNRKPPKFDPREARKNLPNEVDEFANKERLNTHHHMRHSKEMGFSNQTEYQKAAIAFWNEHNEKTFYNPYDDSYCRYDTKTRIFMSISREGIIHTFMRFKTKNGFERVKKQEALYEL